MSAIQEALESYLALRRGLGTELKGPGAYLHRFVDFLDREGATVATTEPFMDISDSVEIVSFTET